MMSKAKETVILVHGFAAHSVVMQPLRYRLSRSGYDTAIWTYPTFSRSIPSLAKDFRDFLQSFEEKGGDYHIVAHSMGSIVARAAIAGQHYSHLKRLVFLAPPNKGLAKVNYVPKFIRKMIVPWNDLSDSPKSFVNELPSADGLQTAILAARYDLLVPIESTHLSGELVHVTLNDTHNSILLSPYAYRFILSFLRHEQFPEVEDLESTLALSQCQPVCSVSTEA